MRDPARFELARNEAAYFDRLVAAEGGFNPFLDRGWETLRRGLRELAGEPMSGAVLDVGCGTGQSRRLYADGAILYTGLDLSHGALQLARRSFEHGNWVRSDARELPFPDETFDVVAFSSVLHHIPDYESAVRAAVRVVRSPGLVLAFDPNLLHPAMAVFRHPRSPLYDPTGVSPHERPLLPSELRRAFVHAGLERVRQRCQSDIPYRSVGPEKLNRWLHLFNLADRVFERSGLGRWFGTFVLTVGQKAKRASPVGATALSA